MRFSGKPTGPLGLALLAVTALAGVALGVHGWSGRHSGLPAGALTGSSPSQAATGQPGRTAGPSAPAASSSAPAATPSGAGASSSGPGPLLSAQSYAQYSFKVWPGTPDTAAHAALTGLTVKVVRHGSGIMVTADVVGQPPNSPRFYARGALVYVVEASLGDDSGNSDYSLGDDGLVVTDAQGRILQ
jgi:hypothetical protein